MLRKREGDREAAARCRKRLLGASFCRLPTYTSAGQAGGIRSEPKLASGTRSSSRVHSLFYLATGLGWTGCRRPPAWRPRKVVGSQAFADLERTKAGLIEKLRLRIDAQEIVRPDGRVLVFTAPSRPIGVPIAVDGAYWMRAGEDLAPMTPDMLRRIFDEAGPDFSAEICPKAAMADLDPAAIESLRRRWTKHSGNNALSKRPADKLLRDAELVLPGGVTYAALILLGSRAALGRFLAQAEVVFEYRSTPRPGPANQREEFRQAFLSFYDRVWELVDLRNDKQHFQERLVMHPVRTFSEIAVREALLNAVSHRDYRHPGSVFVRQFPRRIEIVSPGGFPPGITPDNILDQGRRISHEPKIWPKSSNVCIA